MSSLIKKSMVVAVVLGVWSFSLYSEEQNSGKMEMSSDSHMKTMSNTMGQGMGDKTKAVEKARLAPQTTCPVMGGDIDKSVHVDYKGKRVYFCCTMCPPTFNKDPETYIKKLEALGQGVETLTAPNGKKTAAKDTTTMKMDKSTPMKGMDHSKM
jgi:YHS domain-containing protein